MIEVIETTISGQAVFQLYVIGKGFAVTRNGDGTFLVATVDDTRYSDIETVSTLKAVLDTIVKKLTGSSEVFLARRQLQETLALLYQKG